MSSSIRPVTETALVLPWKLLIAAAQPYQTLSGPALSVNFLQQPTLLSFQRLPLHYPALPAIYFHTLLHSLAEFATTPRPVKGSPVGMLRPPLPQFWRSLGPLNSVYYTSYSPHCRQHPVMGAVELCASSHRRYKDVRLSLYNNQHEVIASMIITGTGEEVQSENNNNSDDNDDLEIPLPHSGLSDEAAALTAEFLGDTKQLEDGSILQKVIFRSGSHQQNTESEINTIEEVVPPWRLDGCVAELCRKFAINGFLAPHVVQDREDKLWTIVAQQTLAHAELILDEPVDVVSAIPRVFENYRMPPWRHRIGLPLFYGDLQPLCVALRVEIRQGGKTMTAGTYFLSEVPLNV